MAETTVKDPETPRVDDSDERMEVENPATGEIVGSVRARHSRTGRRSATRAVGTSSGAPRSGWWTTRIG
jgi:hypothetical protein